MRYIKQLPVYMDSCCERCCGLNVIVLDSLKCFSSTTKSPDFYVYYSHEIFPMIYDFLILTFCSIAWVFDENDQCDISIIILLAQNRTIAIRYREQIMINPSFCPNFTFDISYVACKYYENFQFLLLQLWWFIPLEINLLPQ